MGLNVLNRDEDAAAMERIDRWERIFKKRSLVFSSMGKICS